MAQDTDRIQRAHDRPDKSVSHASFRLCEGRVLVFHRADSPNWSARWRAQSGTYVQLSLRTPDRELAAERATREYMEFEFRLRHGLSVRTTGFGHACDLMLEELEAELRATGGRMDKLKEYRSRVDRYLRPFFGDRAVDTITTAEIARYRDWRTSYLDLGPGQQGDRDRLFPARPAGEDAHGGAAQGRWAARHSRGRGAPPDLRLRGQARLDQRRSHPED